MIDFFYDSFSSRLTVLGSTTIVVLLAIVAGVLTWVFYTQPTLRRVKENNARVVERFLKRGFRARNDRHPYRPPVLERVGDAAKTTVTWFYKLSGFKKRPMLSIRRGSDQAVLPFDASDSEIDKVLH